LLDDGQVAYTTVSVNVEDTLKSHEAVDGAVTFDLFVPAPKLVSVVEQSLPKDQMLLFFVSDAGRLRLTSPVSYMQELDGRVGVPLFAEEDWLKDLDGASFAGLVDQARTKAASGPE
jgi:hypothetical protein